MQDRDDERRPGPERRSASADAAALRREEGKPDPEDGEESAERKAPPRPEQGRPSASAEAAALRWRDQHPDDD